MSKQPTPNTDPWQTIQDALDRIEAEFRYLRELAAKALADYEADKAIDDALRRRVGPRFLASQEPRIDGDHEPWAPMKPE